jgi:hypothetical protein
MHYIDSWANSMSSFSTQYTRDVQIMFRPFPLPYPSLYKTENPNDQIAPAHLSLPNDKEPTTKICLSVLRWLENLLHSLDICDGFIEHS